MHLYKVSEEKQEEDEITVKKTFNNRFCLHTVNDINHLLAHC